MITTKLIKIIIVHFTLKAVFKTFNVTLQHKNQEIDGVISNNNKQMREINIKSKEM